MLVFSPLLTIDVNLNGLNFLTGTLNFKRLDLAQKEVFFSILLPQTHLGRLSSIPHEVLTSQETFGQFDIFEIMLCL